MKIQGMQIERKQCCIEVDPRECLKALIEECGVPYDIFEKDGKFVRAEDISGHGRPVYEYETFGMANSINFY